MKASLAIGVLLLLLSGTSTATLRTVQDVVQVCNPLVDQLDGKKTFENFSEADMLNYQECYGYFNAFRITTRFYEKLLTKEKVNSVYRICYPKKTSMAQIIRVIHKAVRENPDQHHKNAFVFSIQMMAVTFPCVAPR